MGSMAENPILIDKKQDKENSSPPLPTTPFSETPTQPAVLMRSRPFGTKNEMIPITLKEVCWNEL